MLGMKKTETQSNTQPSMRALEFDVIIGKNSSIEGTVRSGGSIRIDGRICGDIASEGEVIVGPEANCSGNISACTVEISGTVTGDITSTGCLRIFSTGVLNGNIEASNFVIDEGGVFEGQCHINTRKPDTGKTPLEPKTAPEEAPEKNKK